MKKILNVLFYIAIIVVIVGGGWYVWNMKTDVAKQDNNKTMNQIDLPDGVEVVERDGERILRDNRYGYEVEIGNRKIVSEPNGFSFYNVDFEYFPVYTIRILEKTKLSLENWLLDYHKKNFLLYYNEKKDVKIDGLSAIKIKNEGEPENYTYYFKYDDRIFAVSEPTEVEQENITNLMHLIRGKYEKQ